MNWSRFDSSVLPDRKKTVTQFSQLTALPFPPPLEELNSRLKTWTSSANRNSIFWHFFGGFLTIAIAWCHQEHRKCVEPNWIDAVHVNRCQSPFLLQPLWSRLRVFLISQISYHRRNLNLIHFWWEHFLFHFTNSNFRCLHYLRLQTEAESNLNVKYTVKQVKNQRFDWRIEQNAAYNYWTQQFLFRATHELWAHNLVAFCIPSE